MQWQIAIILALFLVHIHSGFGYREPDRNCSCAGLGNGCNFTRVYCSPIDNNCNKKNVALGKPTQASSVYFSSWYTPENLQRIGCMAVNGNRDHVFQFKLLGPDMPNCHRSEVKDLSPFWEVNLGHPYTITDITIYASTSHLRMLSVHVHVDGQVCYTFPESGDIPLINHISCRRPVTGSIIRLYKTILPQSTDSGLLFCEVEVWVCRHGFYGPTCDRPCPVNCISCDNYFGNCTEGCISGFYGRNCDGNCGQCKDVKCDVATGTCPSGCASGWQGDRCDKVCEPGYFGINCTEKCEHCVNGTVCSRVTGLCSAGCDAGWHGSFCNETCSPGYWGPHCMLLCGYCLLGTVCGVYRGECPGGCDRGWRSVYCNESCTHGRYGPDCKYRCANCKQSNECNIINGTCPGECIEGFRLPDCVRACKSGTYGVNCIHRCGNCRAKRICNQITGKCPDICATGWKGLTCNETCLVGTYGEDCMEKCGHCTDGACHSGNGTCLHGCQSGYTGDTCEEEDPYVKVYYFVTGSAIIMAQIFVMFLVWICRSKRKSEQKLRVGVRIPRPTPESVPFVKVFDAEGNLRTILQKDSERKKGVIVSELNHSYISLTKSDTTHSKASSEGTPAFLRSSRKRSSTVRFDKGSGVVILEIESNREENETGITNDGDAGVTSKVGPPTMGSDCYIHSDDKSDFIGDIAERPTFSNSDVEKMRCLKEEEVQSEGTSNLFGQHSHHEEQSTADGDYNAFNETRN